MAEPGHTVRRDSLAARALAGAARTALRAARLGGRVVRNFLHNKGLLLASAVGYNALLSLVPLIAITLVLLSQLVDESVVSPILVARLRPLAPGLAPTLQEAVSSFVEHRNMVGWGGLLALFLVSSAAFRTIEEAMGLIFRRPGLLRPRPLWVSALIQFGYVPLVGIGLGLLTVVSLALGALANGEIFGVRWFAPLAGALPAALAALAFAVAVALLTSFYWIMPVVRVPARLALVGGGVAAVLWHCLSRALGWFFEHLSLVNVLYGSLGTVIMVLVSMEAFAVILLLCAQLVADVHRSWRAGRRWYEPLPELAPLSIDLS
ncbi:MAG: YihY/virulence factor BrkB family protein [Deltaproteobacteria bacterium]|nr:YihY/virulence factor BrkB family protein [Deltaproteobacteria bacterium]